MAINGSSYFDVLNPGDDKYKLVVFRRGFNFRLVVVCFLPIRLSIHCFSPMLCSVHTVWRKCSGVLLAICDPIPSRFQTGQWCGFYVVCPTSRKASNIIPNRLSVSRPLFMLHSSLYMQQTFVELLALSLLPQPCLFRQMPFRLIQHGIMIMSSIAHRHYFPSGKQQIGQACTSNTCVVWNLADVPQSKNCSDITVSFWQWEDYDGTALTVYEDYANNVSPK